MSEIKISLHTTQKKVWVNPKRFKTIVAGRRWGKTTYALGELVQKAFMASDGVGFYVAPTLQQAKDLVWQPLKQLLSGVKGCRFVDTTGECTLPNGRSIMLKGSDRPDTLRGNKLFHAVVDEYQDMKPNVYESIIRPALADLRGTATIIGTPKGRSHFYHFNEKNKTLEDWACFHFTTYDNPHIPRSEIEALKNEMSSFFFEQEILAKFAVANSDLFRADWIKIARASDNPWIRQGVPIATADLAGFTDFAEAMLTTNPNSRLDEFAISVVTPVGRQWHVHEIATGRDTVAKTARRMLGTAAKWRATTLGVEKGALFQAIYPQLQAESSRLPNPIRIKELTHGNQGKVERILWGLQGKLEHGLITFEPGEYVDKFVEQLLQIPNKGVHDDMPDSLSMIAQLAPLGIHLDEKDILSSYVDNIDTDY